MSLPTSNTQTPASQLDSEGSPLFLKIRAIIFSVVSLAGLLWIVSLAVVLFTRWDVFGSSQRTLVLLMLVTHCVTVIMLLVLLILSFRPWLDSARVVLVLVGQIGTASAFAFWYPEFPCPPEGIESCKVIIAYILILSWIVPAVLIFYICGMCVMIWRRSSSPPMAAGSTTSTSSQPATDIEKGPDIPASRPSALYTVRPNTMTPTSSSPNTPISATHSRTLHLSLIPGKTAEKGKLLDLDKWRPPTLFIERPPRRNTNHASRHTVSYSNPSPIESARHEQFLDIFAPENLYNFSPYRKQAFNDWNENTGRRGSSSTGGGVAADKGERPRRLSKPAPVAVAW